MPPLCTKSWIAPGQTLPGTVEQPFTGGAEVCADGWPEGDAAFEAGATWIEGFGGDGAALRRACAEPLTVYDASLEASSNATGNATATGCMLGETLGLAGVRAFLLADLFARLLV